MRRVLLATAVALAGCAFYGPTFVDCSVRCDASRHCPSGLTCTAGFCRAPNAPGTCECRPGEQTSCGGGKGECTPGVKTCNSTGTWSDTCVGEGRPSREVCDGKDNDCNGLVDDNPTDLRPCAVDAGVCSTVFQRCVDGGQVACTVADYPSTYEPVGAVLRRPGQRLRRRRRHDAGGDAGAGGAVLGLLQRRRRLRGRLRAHRHQPRRRRRAGGGPLRRLLEARWASRCRWAPGRPSTGPPARTARSSSSPGRRASAIQAVRVDAARRRRTPSRASRTPGTARR